MVLMQMLGHVACTGRVRGVKSRVITHEYKRPCTHWRQLALPAGATWYSHNATGQSAFMQRKQKFMLFSDHDRSPPKLQLEAMTTGHSPKGKEKDLTPRWIGPVLSNVVCPLFH